MRYTCPVCEDEDCEIADPKVGDLVECDRCGAELRVTCVAPLELCDAQDWDDGATDETVEIGWY